MPVGASITGAVASGLTAVGLGDATAAIAAPIIIGAGSGALVSGVTGGNPLTGALLGGAAGGVGGAFGAAGPASESAYSNTFGNLLGVAGDSGGGDGGVAGAGGWGDGSDATLSPPAVTTAPLDPTSTAIGGDTATATGTPALYDNTDPMNRGEQVYNNAIGPNAGPGGANNFSAAASSAAPTNSDLTNAAILKALSGKGSGINTTTAALGLLAAGAQYLGGPPKQGTYPLPGPSSTAATQGPYFNQPLQPFTGPGRAPVNPLAGQPTSSWYTYGQNPGANFFTNNSLTSYGYNPSYVPAAKGGHIRKLAGGGAAIPFGEPEMAAAELPFGGSETPSGAPGASTPGGAPSTTSSSPGSGISLNSNDLASSLAKGALSMGLNAAVPGLGTLASLGLAAANTYDDISNLNEAAAQQGQPSASVGETLGGFGRNVLGNTIGNALSFADPASVGKGLSLANDLATTQQSTDDLNAGAAAFHDLAQTATPEQLAATGTPATPGAPDTGRDPNADAGGLSGAGNTGAQGDRDNMGSGFGSDHGDTDTSDSDGGGGDGERMGGRIRKRRKKGALSRARGGRIGFPDGGSVNGLSGSALTDAENAYLAENPDVLNYYLANQATLGNETADDFAAQHYGQYGQAEGRSFAAPSGGGGNSPAGTGLTSSSPAIYGAPAGSGAADFIQANPTSAFANFLQGIQSDPNQSAFEAQWLAQNPNDTAIETMPAGWTPSQSIPLGGLAGLGSDPNSVLVREELTGAPLSTIDQQATAAGINYNSPAAQAGANAVTGQPLYSLPPPAPTVPTSSAAPPPFVPSAPKPLPGAPAWSPASSQWFDNNGNFAVPPPTAGMADGGFFKHLARGGVLDFAPLIHALGREKHFAGGGGPEFSTGGGDHYVQGPGDGQSDSVKAALSDGEFVFDSTTVSRIGNGSNRKGALALEKARRAIARDAGSPRVVQKKIKKSPLQYIAEAAR